MKISDLIALDRYFPDHDPYMQFSALEEFVNTLRERSGLNTANIEINRISGAYTNDDPRHGDSYADDCASSEYFDAFLSSSIAACLAQYIEGVIRHETYLICFQQRGNPSGYDNMRFKSLSLDEFWNISNYYDCTTGNSKKNIVLGIKQLFEAIGCINKLPKNFETTLQVLFKYRNNVMHNGIEWPERTRESFNKFIQKNHNNSFIWSVTNNKLWIAHMSNVYIDELIKFCGALRDGFKNTSHGV